MRLSSSLSPDKNSSEELPSAAAVARADKLAGLRLASCMRVQGTLCGCFPSAVPGQPFLPRQHGGAGGFWMRQRLLCAMPLRPGHVSVPRQHVRELTLPLAGPGPALEGRTAAPDAACFAEEEEDPPVAKALATPPRARGAAVLVGAAAPDDAEEVVLALALAALLLPRPELLPAAMVLGFWIAIEHWAFT